MTDKEQIEKIDEIAEDLYNNKLELREMVQNYFEKDEQVDNMAHVIKVKNKEMRELSVFLKERNIPLKELSPLITVMNRVEELEEENKQIKTAYQDRVDDIESMREMLGLTWEHFQDETGQPIEKLQGDEINRLQEENHRYKQALEKIAQDTGTPYADIAIKALEESE